MTKHKISRNLEVSHIPSTMGYPEHIFIVDPNADNSAIVIWNQKEALALAYKLMSLASEMK